MYQVFTLHYNTHTHIEWDKNFLHLLYISLSMQKKNIIIIVTEFSLSKKMGSEKFFLKVKKNDDKQIITADYNQFIFGHNVQCRISRLATRKKIKKLMNKKESINITIIKQLIDSDDDDDD